MFQSILQYIFQTFSNYRVYRLLCLLFLCVVWYITKFYSLDCLFTATYKQHQVWYPNLFVISFLSTKLLYSLFYSLWFFLIVPKGFLEEKSRKVQVVTTVVAVFIVLFVLGFVNFEWLKILFVPLMILEIIIWFLPLIFMLFARYVKMKFAILLVYAILCLVMPDHFLPFYKFSMFNTMKPSGKIILFKDESGKLIPFVKFTTASAVELLSIYEMEKGKGSSDREVGKAVLDHALQLKPKENGIIPQEVYLHYFMLQDNNLLEKETLLYEMEI